MALVPYDNKILKKSSTEKAVEVPKNDLAKLMYYLSCVSSLISFKCPSKLYDYQKYFNLEREEINKLLYFIGALSPEILIEKKIFVKSNELCASFSNEFYDISENSSAPLEIYIGGKKCETFSMMACTENWLEENYYAPKRAFSDQIFNIIMNS